MAHWHIAHTIPNKQTLAVYAAAWLAWGLLLVVPTRYLVLLAGLYEFSFRLLPVQVGWCWGEE